MNKAKLFTSVATAALLGSASLASVAAPITVEGITWDPQSFIDFSAQNVMFVNDLSAVGDVASGMGQVSAINGSSNFGSNELTYIFGDYEIATLNGNDATFSGGWVKFYSDANTNFDFTDMSTASDGTLWLSLEAADLNGNSLIGTLASLNVDGNAQGLLNAVGGAALANFDTNTRLNGADFEFTASWNQFPNGGSTVDGLAHVGTSELIGNSIPTPAPLAMMLLGLGMVGFSMRKSSKKG